MNKTILIMLGIVSHIFTSVQAKENTNKQIATIHNFYEIIQSTSSPTVAEFFKLFGEDNEAELDLVLSTKFPALNKNSNWYKNKEAIKYTNQLYEHPENFSSLFLQCIKSLSIFSSKSKYLIQSSPKVKDDLRIFTVITAKQKILFQFSQDEPFIENIDLPDGKSAYDIKCK